MPFFIAAAITAAAGVGSAVISASGAKSAAKTEANAANAANQLQSQEFQQTQQNLAPYQAAGTNSLAALMSGLGLEPGGSGQGALNTPFSMAQYTASPGYNFQLQQGLGAAQNAASTSGGIGGNSLKALEQYGQGLAATDYQQAYSNYTGQQNQQYNMLAGLVNSGQSAAAGVSQAGQNYATAAGNNTMSAANATAAGQVAGTNATTGAITGAASSIGNNYLLSQLLAQQQGAGGGLFAMPAPLNYQPMSLN